MLENKGLNDESANEAQNALQEPLLANENPHDEFQETGPDFIKKPSTIKEHKTLVYAACAVAFCGYIMIANVAPFFPQYAQREYDMDSSTVGIIFATLPLTTMITSPLCGFVCSKVGRVRMTCLGLAGLAGGAAWFGLARSPLTFILSRALQGLGSACESVATLALLVDNLDDHSLTDALAWQEMAVGLGFILGPPLGGVLYTVGGFTTAFLVLSAFPAMLLLILPAVLFSKYGKKAAQEQMDQRRTRSQQERDREESRVPLRVLANTTILLGSASTALAFMSLGFLDPTLAKHLELSLDCSELATGWLFAAPSVLYALASMGSSKICQRFGYRLTVVIGMICLGLSFLMIGPVPLLDFLFRHRPAVWTVTVISLVLLGLGLAFSLIPLLPLMKASVASLDQRTKDMLASIFNAANSAGECLGPIVGGILVQHLPTTKEVTCRGDATRCYNAFPWASSLFGVILLLSALMVQLCIPKFGQDSDGAPLVISRKALDGSGDSETKVQRTDAHESGTVQSSTSINS